MASEGRMKNVLLLLFTLSVTMMPTSDGATKPAMAPGVFPKPKAMPEYRPAMSL